MPQDEVLLAGRAAAAVGDWAGARSLLGPLDSLEGLEPPDLDLLGWAHLFGADGGGAVGIWQRAFAAYMRDGQPRAAGMIALNLTLTHFARGAGSIGAAWLRQVSEHLGTDENAPEYAWPAWLEVLLSAEGGSDPAAALPAAQQAAGLARRLGNADAEALATLLVGQLQLAGGRLAEATAALDQVMVMATGGLLGPLATGFVFCGTVSSCTSAGDYQRAWEWTHEVARCSIGPPSRPDFPGDCRLHRAELLRLRGRWTDAELEVAAICADVESWSVGHAAEAYAELGELSRCRGDLDAAEVAFRRAAEHGSAVLPGGIELLLARGEVEQAAAGARTALASLTDPCARARMLPVALDAAIATADLAWADDLAGEQQRLTLSYPLPAHQARAALAVGTIALARGDGPAAAERLREAIALWRRCQAPYEVARTNVLLAAALAATGDPAGQATHLTTAYDEFVRLGAVADARRAAELLGRPVASERVSRALMFTDIEGSTQMLAELGDDAWLELLRWHDAALRQLFARHHGVEVHQKGGGDGFFVAFPSAAAGLDCAIEIQQRLEATPEGTVLVRIGVHWADVVHSSGDFSGRGVHEAARIAALGAGGEILTSVATLQAAGKDYRVRDSRAVELRGLPGVMEVASVSG
jgi:class 3 adenylate cyclase